MDNIVNETIESLRDYIPKLISAGQELVNNLQSGNEAKAFSAMPQIIEGLEWAFQAVEGIKKLGKAREIELTDVNSKFNEVINALEVKDYVLLADLFEYEIIPILENWLENINIEQ